MEELMERLHVVVSLLEAATTQTHAYEAAAADGDGERVRGIVATVGSQREEELAERLEAAEAKLADAEQRIAELAAAGAAAQGRKTVAAGVVATLAKQGISASALDSLQAGQIAAGALDSALMSLSIEQRFAVKAELLRTGIIH